MNVTILSLCLSGCYGSALFNPTMKRSVSSFNAVNCKAQKFFKSFLKSPLLSSIHMSDCRFHQFQDSAIAIEQEFLDESLESTAKDQHHIIDVSTKTGAVQISNCVFLRCVADYGGAVKVLAPYNTRDFIWKENHLTISKCTFGDCQAWKTGGAIYIIAIEHNGEDRNEKDVFGSNYLKFCCIGNCGVIQNDASVPNYKRAFAIFLNAEGKDDTGTNTYSLFHVTQSSILNCDSDDHSIQGFTIAGRVVRIRSEHMNITGRQRGNVGAFGTENMDSYGRKDRNGGGFFFFHLEGLRCSCCFYVRAGSPDSGLYVNHSCIVNIELISDPAREIENPSIFFGLSDQMQIDVDYCRFIDVVGALITGTWKSRSFRECYSNINSLTGVSTTTGKETYEISASYFEFCNYDYTGTFLATQTFNPSNTFTSSNVFTIPIETPTATPSQTPAETRSQSPAETRSQSPAETPSRTPQETISRSIEASRSQSQFRTSQVSQYIEEVATTHPPESQNENGLLQDPGPGGTTLFWVITTAGAALLLIAIPCCCCIFFLCCRKKKKQVENENPETDSYDSNTQTLSELEPIRTDYVNHRRRSRTYHLDSYSSDSHSL